MKRLFFAGMALALCVAAGHASAQNNDGYTDDVYYNASRAEQDAEQAAKEESAGDAGSAAYYNSSGQDHSQAYNDGYYDDGDNYIDYDDDSYTMRMRRFYYPMSGIGYWGSVYSPYWNDPFFYNPYYSWGWYTPGFSMSFGYGPYWSSGWGCNTWYGYGGFNSWYYPYYYPYYGYGYGSGYWNGYYAGLYDAGYGNHYAPGRGLNYGPRGARNERLHNSGNYGNGRRTAIQPGRTVTPLRGTRTNPVVSGQRIGADNPRLRESNNRNAIQLQEGPARVYDNNIQTDNRARSGRRGLLRGNQNNIRVIENNNNSRPVRTPRPSQSTERSYTPPQRTYSPPARSSAPSRSYSAPSRQSSGGSRSVGRR